MLRRLLHRVLPTLVVAMLVFGALVSGVGAQSTIIHKVTSGESLSGIANLYGVTIQSIVDANDLASAHWIYIGQELVIPTAVPEYFEYKVVSGDTLLSIAAKHGVTVREILRLNGLYYTSLIFPGQVLRIPGADGTPPTPPSDDAVIGEAIIISTPEFNEDVSSPITVTGFGSGFENNLAVDVLDEAGNVIGQGYVIVDAEFGQIGPFTGTVEFTVATSQMGRVSVYSVSPRDGAIEHLSSVSVRLVP